MYLKYCFNCLLNRKPDSHVQAFDHFPTIQCHGPKNANSTTMYNFYKYLDVHVH